MIILPLANCHHFVTFDLDPFLEMPTLGAWVCYWI